MRLVDELVHKDIAGESVYIPVGQLAQEKHGLFGANETGSFLLKKLANGIELSALIVDFSRYTGLDEEEVKQDVLDFLDCLRTYGILIEES